MKVKELIELLRAMPQDLEVYSVTDHGQAPEKSQAPSIAYMQAQANLKIAEGIAAGKVNTIVVPVDFKGMVNVK